MQVPKKQAQMDDSLARESSVDVQATVHLPPVAIHDQFDQRGSRDQRIHLSKNSQSSETVEKQTKSILKQQEPADKVSIREKSIQAPGSMFDEFGGIEESLGR